MRSFNLLPWRARRREIRRRQALGALACGVIGAAALLAAIEFPLHYRLQAAEQQIAQLKDAIALARGGGADRDALEAGKAQADALLAEVDRIRGNNSAARDWLAALPAQMPPGLRLTSLALSREGWQLRGLAAEPSQPAMLQERIRAMPMVVDVRIERLQSNPGAPAQFLLSGKLGK